MIGVLVVTHGNLAKELVEVSSRIVGDLANVESISMGWHDDADSARERIRVAIQKLDSEEGVLILTDMFGGTPTNIALTFMEKDRVEVVTGVNLPMMVKLSSAERTGQLAEMAQQIRAQGQNSIHVTSEVLARMDS